MFSSYANLEFSTPYLPKLVGFKAPNDSRFVYEAQPNPFLFITKSLQEF